MHAAMSMTVPDIWALRSLEKWLEPRSHGDESKSSSLPPVKLALPTGKWVVSEGRCTQ